MSASSNVIKDYGGTPLMVSIHTRLNIRNGATRAAKLVRRIQPPIVLSADQLVEGEPYLGNAYWFREAQTGCFFWSGAGQPLATPPSTSSRPLKLKRRSDGSILPLSDVDLRKYFGDVKYTSNADGSVTFIAGSAPPVVPFNHALLSRFTKLTLYVHELALPSFVAVFDEIQNAGPALSDLLLSCSGTYVPRHKGGDTKRSLSSHSWGIAIDLNSYWNGYGANPALPGQKGSLLELVPIFDAHGFAWGGHFSPPYRDGMHFELACPPGERTPMQDDLAILNETV